MAGLTARVITDKLQDNGSLLAGNLTTTGCQSYMPMGLPFYIFFLLLTGLFSLQTVAAQNPPLVLKPEAGRYVLGKHLKLLEDPYATLTLGQIQNQDHSFKFQQGQSDNHSFGFTDSAYWVELDIESGAEHTSLWILELAYPLTDYLDVYVIDPNASHTPLHHWRTGDKLPFDTRAIKHQDFAFPIYLSPGQQLKVYLRAQSGNTMALPLSIYSGQAFFEHASGSVIGLGLYYGIMLVMMLYNGFLYLSIRDKSYLYYVLYLAFFTASMLGLNGLAFQYLWPESTWLANHAPPVFAAAAALCGLLFARYFLRINRSYPQLRRAIKLMIWVECILILWALTASHEVSTPTVFPLQIIALALILTAGVSSLRSGYRPARFYLLAWIGFIVGCSLRVLLGAGFVPSNFVTEYAVQFGSALEVILLSLALADRINRIQIKANKNALLAKENALIAKANAEKANRAKSLFVADVSHELRTPLNAVLGYTQMLSQDPSIGPRQQQQLEVVDKSGNHLLGLINNILDLSKLEAGADELTPQDVDLIGQVKDILLMLKPHCEAKSVLLTLDNQGPDVLPVHVDISKLRQVLINLIGNATKFTERGSITLSIQSVNDDLFHFAVTDTGCGIDNSQQQRIFDAFGQTEQGNKAGGTGLGLAIAAKLVQLMGSELKLESSPGQGSRFYFTLSLMPAKKPIGVCNTPKAQKVKLGANQTATAMIVEDIQESGEMLEQMLQSVGLSTTLKAHGQAALEALAAQEKLPDIIFLDIRMPIMDGVTTIKNIRQQFKAPPPIVAISAHAMEKDIQYYRTLGFSDYITKPFRFDSIYQCLQSFVAAEFVDDSQQKQVSHHDIDLEQLLIPEIFHRRMTIAAQNYEITLLEECMRELSQHSESGKQLCNALKPHLSTYNMDAALVELQRVTVVSHDR